MKNHIFNFQIKIVLNPQQILITSQDTADRVVELRRNLADTIVPFISSLMREESQRVAQRAEATFTSLQTFYNHPSAARYSFDQAMDAIATLSGRARTTLIRKLRNDASELAKAPHAALWDNLPPSIVRPPTAIRPTGNLQSASA